MDKVIVFRRLDEGWEKEDGDLFAEDLLLDVPKNSFVEPLEVESLIRAVMRLSFMQQ